MPLVWSQEKRYFNELLCVPLALPQESIPVPFLLIIYTCDLLISSNSSECTSSANDTIP